MLSTKLERMGSGAGFIAALDQSGGSTPRALKLYGIEEDRYSNDDEMFDLVHAMRERIVTSPAFTSEHILAAILFEKTMDRTFAGQPAADYLWDTKKILPILKVDKGLADPANGVRLMKPIGDLDDLLERAKKAHIFGTKMRSVVLSANAEGIASNVNQQFVLRQIRCRDSDWSRRSISALTRKNQTICSRRSWATGNRNLRPADHVQGEHSHG